MSLRPFRYPLALRLRASRRLCFLLAAIHALAALAFLRVRDGDWLGSAAGLAVVVASLLWSWRREQTKAGRMLILEDGGRLAVEGTGGMLAAQPLPGCTDFGWALWLQWRVVDDVPARARAGGELMLLPDHVPPECWPAIRAWLRHKADVDEEGGAGTP